MSRLESFIRRLDAQRLVLNLVAPLIAEVPGPVMEIGLGNGRTYDHLRALLPARRIICFDRVLGAHPSCVPPAGDLFLGEIAQTAQPYRGFGAALVHADIGTGIAAKDAQTITWLPDLAAEMLVPGGYAASGLPLIHEYLKPIALPVEIEPERYFLYQRRQRTACRIVQPMNRA